MSADKFIDLPLRPSMTVGELCEVMMNDFEKTGLNSAEFEIPGTDGANQFVLHFEISLRPVPVGGKH
jgi:hypothetical protein